MSRATAITPGQVHLPGDEFEPSAAQRDISPLAHRYMRTREQRMETLKAETNLKGKLCAIMVKHNLTEFVVDGLIITREPGPEKLRVRPAKDEDDDSQLAIDDGYG